MNDSVKAPTGTQAAVRAIHLLKAFSAQRPEMSLAELCARVGLTKTTTHRLLAALVSEGLVEKDGNRGRYRLGPGIMTLAANLSAGQNLIANVHAVLESLAADTGETASLEVHVNGAMLILDEVPGRHLVNAAGNIGTQWPIHATSTGKVCLAFSKNGERLLQPPLQRFTSDTVIDKQQWGRLIKQVRQQGYATTRNELEDGYAAVAAPILASDGTFRAAISIGGPVQRLDTACMKSLGLRLRNAAKGLSIS